MTRTISLLLLLCFLTSACRAENWPAWRGPKGTGVSSESEFPTKWTNTDNVKWAAPMPAPGNSTPIIWGNRVFVTCALEKGTRRTLMCLDRANGKLLWQQEMKYAGTEPTHKDNPYCSASPVTDGERVIVWHGSAGLAAYDFEGKQLWARTDLGEFNHIWGNASSPVIHGDMVIGYFGPGLNVYLAAFDKKTGKDIWKVDLPNAKSKTPQEFFGGWNCPVIREVNGKSELLIGLPKQLTAFNPADGKEIWKCMGLGPLVYNDVLYSDDVLVSMSGYSGPAIGVKSGGTGDVTETHRLWRNEREQPQRVGSGVIVGKHMYILNDPGFAQCIEIATGKEIWREKLGGQAWTSMVSAGDKLYVIDTKGITYVLKASPEYSLISKNPVGELTRASVALSDGQVFIRTYQNLYCIGK
jgi:outer membrane protein assembly factor BamB